MYVYIYFFKSHLLMLPYFESAFGIIFLARFFKSLCGPNTTTDIRSDFLVGEGEQGKRGGLGKGKTVQGGQIIVIKTQ